MQLDGIFNGQFSKIQSAQKNSDVVGKNAQLAHIFHHRIQIPADVAWKGYT